MIEIAKRLRNGRADVLYEVHRRKVPDRSSKCGDEVETLPSVSDVNPS